MARGPFTIRLARPAFQINRAGHLVLDPGPRNISVFFCLETLARWISWRPNKSHIREVADFRAHMNMLQKVQG